MSNQEYDNLGTYQLRKCRIRNMSTKDRDESGTNQLNENPVGI